jgi:hypothetical protein
MPPALSDGATLMGVYFGWANKLGSITIPRTREEVAG